MVTMCAPSMRKPRTVWCGAGGYPIVTVQFLAVAMLVSAPAAVAGSWRLPLGGGVPRDCMSAFAAAALSFVALMSRVRAISLDPVVKPLPMPGRVTDSSDEQ